MTSLSVSDYQNLCKEHISEVLKRPRMYFESLKDLQSAMAGHALAFIQLEIIDREQSFHTCFSDWLYENKGASGAAGWAYAITKLLTEEGDDPEKCFTELVNEFLAQWGH